MAKHPGRFSYVQYDNVGVEQQAVLKAKFEEIEKILGMNFPEGPSAVAYIRAKALALTHLEESYMWAGKAVRDAQVARSHREVVDQPARSDS